MYCKIYYIKNTKYNKSVILLKIKKHNTNLNTTWVKYTT